MTRVLDPDPSTGNITGQFGLLCSDGAFVQPTAWPTDSQCIITNTCVTFPTPPATSLFKSLGLSYVVTGSDIYYQVKTIN